MFYYKKNIGDYYKKTGRLSMLEHGAYTMLIDSCYDRERFPTLDDALDWTWARTDEEIAAVKFVLNKFFTFDGEFYVQSRIQDELDHYHKIGKINQQIAIEREEKRRKLKESVNDTSTNRAQVVNEAPPNQEPRTKNQEPIYIQDKPEKFNFKKSLVDLAGDEQLVSDWLTVRKTKKASNTETALKGFLGKVEKSGLDLKTILKICVERSWTGFDQSWLSNVNVSDYQEKSNLPEQQTEQPRPVLKTKPKNYLRDNRIE